MPADTLSLANEIRHRVASAAADGVIVRSSEAAFFVTSGLLTAEDFLSIPGEIVSGHPDRHVMRVVLTDGRIAYLKREHVIRSRDRYRNWRAGFGWASKSRREGLMLQEIAERQISAPRWLAFGEDKKGRAFLLLEEVKGAEELRRALPQVKDEKKLAIRLGRFCAELHEAGIDHPDLCAKHILISLDTEAVTLLDWQRAKIGRSVSSVYRARAMAHLQATLANAGTEFAAQLLRSYLQFARVCSKSNFERRVTRLAARLRRRRSIRDQSQPALAAGAQRLIWLNGEACCAIPEVVEDLQTRDAQDRLYDARRDGSFMPLSNGMSACLRVRERYAVLGRAWAWLRGAPGGPPSCGQLGCYSIWKGTMFQRLNCWLMANIVMR